MLLDLLGINKVIKQIKCKLQKLENNNNSSGNYVDKYSIDEQIVGEWIDGKPIYRRVFSGTVQNLGYGLFLEQHTQNDIEKMFGVEVCLFITATESTPAQIYDIVPRLNTLQYNPSNSKISGNLAAGVEGSYVYSIKYTKTTD
jgi:hypothetical protein